MPRGRGTAKTASPTDLEGLKAVVGILDRRGHTQYEIAVHPRVKELTGGKGVSQPTICNYLKEIREEYKARYAEARARAVEEKCLQLAELRAEAWAAYDLSRKNKTRKVTERVPLGPGKPKGRGGKERTQFKSDIGRAEESMIRLKEIVTTEGRLPSNEYLVTVLKTLEMEMRLYGIGEEKDEGNNTAAGMWGLFIEWVSSRASVLQSNPVPLAGENSTPPLSLPSPPPQEKLPPRKGRIVNEVEREAVADLPPLPPGTKELK